jgi:hypothetical protein
LHPRSCQLRRGESKPHDYGPGRAIYSRAEGDTIMSNWALIAAASEDETGRVRLVREYRLGPGVADFGARSSVRWQCIPGDAG